MHSSIARSSRSHVGRVREFAMLLTRTSVHTYLLLGARAKTKGGGMGTVASLHTIQYIQCAHHTTHTTPQRGTGDRLIIGLTSQPPTTNLNARIRHLLVYRRRHCRSLQPCSQADGSLGLRRAHASGSTKTLYSMYTRTGIAVRLRDYVEGGCFIRMENCLGRTAMAITAALPVRPRDKGPKGQKSHVRTYICCTLCTVQYVRPTTGRVEPVRLC